MVRAVRLICVIYCLSLKCTTLVIALMLAALARRYRAVHMVRVGEIARTMCNLLL